MQLARVTGTLVASRKDPLLEGMTFLVLQQVAADSGDEGGFVVAVDAVGAGVGEVVMYQTL
jgi:microcompartment protein CcmK/EutM